jgi:hypothetical protein
MPSPEVICALIASKTFFVDSSSCRPNVEFRAALDEVDLDDVLLDQALRDAVVGAAEVEPAELRRHVDLVAHVLPHLLEIGAQAGLERLAVDLQPAGDVHADRRRARPLVAEVERRDQLREQAVAGVDREVEARPDADLRRERVLAGAAEVGDALREHGRRLGVREVRGDELRVDVCRCA